MALESTQLLTEMSNSVLLQAWSGPEGSRKLRLPDFVTTAQGGGKVVSGRLYPDRKDYMSMKISNNTIWDRTSDLPICSTTP